MPTRLSSIARFRKQLKLSSQQTEEKPKKKKSALFSVIEHMGGDKCPWEQLTDEEKESVKPWVMLKWLSTYEEYVPIFSIISTHDWDPKVFYELMCLTLRRQRHYFNSPIYKKVELDYDEVLVRCVMHELFYTKEKAIEYCEDIDPREAEYMKKRWEEIVKDEMQNSDK
jgi:hypothetical protein